MKFKVFCLGIAVLVWFPFGLQGAHPALNRVDLGREVCGGFGDFCSHVWVQGLALGEPFNSLIFNACSVVEYREGDHPGIKCVERAIEKVSHMAPADLIFGQFGKGERNKNAIWRKRPNKDWADLIKQMILEIPANCDQKTPEIFYYFSCLLYDVVNLPELIKKMT